MNTRFAIPAAVVAGASLLAPCRGGPAEGPKGTDRVKVVRAAYEKLPPTILGVKEPIQVKQCQRQNTPACFNLVITEGGRTHNFDWWLEKGRVANKEYDRIEWVSYKGEPFRTPKGAKRLRLGVRGPEEHALYGLLLRWAAAKGKEKNLSAFDEAKLKDVKVLLENLDERFAGETPAHVK